MQRRIAYEGSEFTIEWYCDSKGHSQALEYFEEQPKDKQRKVLNLFRLMGEQGKIFDETKFRHEGEFMPSNRNLIVTYAFSSKERKLL